MLKARTSYSYTISEQPKNTAIEITQPKCVSLEEPEEPIVYKTQIVQNYLEDLPESEMQTINLYSDFAKDSYFKRINLLGEVVSEVDKAKLRSNINAASQTQLDTLSLEVIKDVKVDGGFCCN